MNTSQVPQDHGFALREALSGWPSDWQPIATMLGLRIQRGRRSPFVVRVDALAIPRGRFTTVLGANGCGKTSLMMVLGLMRGFERDHEFIITCRELSYRLDRPVGMGRSAPDYEGPNYTYHVYRHGQMVLKERHERESLRRALIGFSLQGGELVPSLSLIDNVAVPAHLGGLPEPLRRARKRLERLGLGRLAGRLPHELSGGQKQRGVFARALVHDPPIVILDEPTSSLDRNTAQGAVGSLKEESRVTGRTVIMVTHDSSLAERFSDYLIRMDLNAVGSTGGSGGIVVSREIVDYESSTSRGAP